eukprot:COSAG02_NODE_287_length_25647_cov_245.259316_21_plen_61_part_00
MKCKSTSSSSEHIVDREELERELREPREEEERELEQVEVELQRLSNVVYGIGHITQAILY